MQDKISASIAYLEAPRRLVFREETIDLGALGPGEFVGRTITSVVSPGTEVAAYVGLPPLRAGPVYPRLVGYCNLAEVVAVGPSVTRFSPGDRVLTFQSHRSAYRTTEDSVIAVVPPSVPPAEAAATYLYHLGLNALHRARLVPGQTVAVVGLGTLGLATVAVADSCGANVVSLSDSPEARARAEAVGAREVFAKDDVERAIQWASQAGAQAGIDTVVTTSNRWSDWLLALKLVRKGGTIVIIGFPGRGEPLPTFNPLASEHVYDKQLTIIAAGETPDLDVPAHDLRFTIKRNCAYLLDLIGRRKLDARLLVSETQPRDGLATVYERLASREPTLVTCALDWQEGPK